MKQRIFGISFILFLLWKLFLYVICNMSSGYFGNVFVFECLDGVKASNCKVTISKT